MAFRRKEPQRVLAALKQYGMLLLTDARLPSVCSLVTGAPVRGSWWAHARSHDIFRVNSEIAEHPDVLVVRLVSAKITYVHRSLWPQIVAIGRARAAWQLERISKAAGELLKEVDRAPVRTDRHSAKAASELEKVLLVSSEQVHTAAGSHARQLESWDHWTRRKGLAPSKVDAGKAIDKLESVIESLNRQFEGRGRPPWHS